MSDRPQAPDDDAAFAVLPGVGRAAIRARLEGHDAVPTPADGALSGSAAVFVTLRIDGELRGCIGSLTAMHDDLVAEVADRARAAAFDDPRFAPLALDELAHTSVEISILGELEPATRDQLDPAMFGVEVSDTKGRRGVLLPEIEGVDTVDEQVEIARRKAGIPPGNELRLRRFAIVKVPDADFEAKA
jgi:AmmeMemoRadiSam system protein A